jgi:hypothetical protein
MTQTREPTVQATLDDANPNLVPSALQKVKLGRHLFPLKIVFAGLTAAAAFDITQLRSFATLPAGFDIDDDEDLPAALHVNTLRVTASGTANSVGSYGMTDAGGTTVSPTAGANMGIAKISDDGKTITFPTTVTAFVIEYTPRSYTPLTNRFAPLGG